MDSTKQSEEEIEQLKKQIVSLQDKKKSIGENRSSLQLDLAELKESDAIRAKALHEDCEVLNKSKNDFVQKCEHSNTQSSLHASKLREYQERLDREFVHGDNSMDVVDTEAQGEAQNAKSNIAEIASQVAELEPKVRDLEEKAQEALEDKLKLEQNLTETLAEFKKLETFAQSLQSRYGEIQLWYEAFDAWNQTSTCDHCKTAINVGAIIAEELERKHKNDGSSTNTTSISAS